MLLTAFFLTCAAAIAFMCLGTKASKKWVSHSFYMYGILFTFGSLILLVINVQQNENVIRTTIQSIMNRTEMTAEAEPVLTSESRIKDSVHLKAPLIKQLPELPRGCEVTSLSMLLGYHGIEINKMELAAKVKKNPRKHKIINDKVHYGNPHNGFVGDMKSFENPGLGVYHQPIAQLAKEYIDPQLVRDFTGNDFSEIIRQLNEKRPVWVIINATYKKLPAKAFMTWQTEDGPMKVTRWEHSVLITGYDEKYIYFNDPLDKTTKAPMQEFKEAWEQMGKQAITIR